MNYTSIINYLNIIYKEILFSKTESACNLIDETIAIFKVLQPEILIDHIEFKFMNGEFYLAYTELPVGIEFYETDEDFNEAY